MYAEYFHLKEPPFSLTPDPRFFFMSERHREGLAHLIYGVQQPGGFVLLTGETGTGKTTLCRCLVEQLPPDTDIALILNPRLTALELLEAVCDELEVSKQTETASIKALIDALNRHLLQSHSQHRRTVLIIDEAQNLDSEVLEQIRLLTNLETSREKLLQIILIGQPELLSLLKRPGLRQLAQRITARYHLQALSRRETYAYIRHRLNIAGRRDTLFTKAAMRKVYCLSRGMPRLINIICDRALLGAYALDKPVVTAAILSRAGRETQGDLPWHRKIRMIWAAGILALIILLAGATFFFDPAHRFAFKLSEARMSAANGSQNHGIPSNTSVAAMPRPDIVGSAITKIPVVAPVTTKAKPSTAGLVEILTNPDLRGSPVSSFISLYRRWGSNIAMSASDYGCKVGRSHGYECLFQSGSWTKIRRFNLPAILELRLPTGQNHRVTLVGLGENEARLEIGDREYVFPIEEIDKVWDGSFILVWKPPFPPRRLAPGSKGMEVAWVRRVLGKIEGENMEAESADYYDEKLQQRVRKFQREHFLVADGYIGIETLVRLSVAAGDAQAPSLLQQSP